MVLKLPPKIQRAPESERLFRVGGLLSRKLNLDLSGINEEGAWHIVSHLKEITALRLSFCDDKGVLYIVKALQTNSFLTELHLVESLPDLTCSALTEMIRINRSLKYLEVSGNDLSGPAKLILSDIFEALRHNTSLVNLSLRDNAITATDPDTASSLTKMLQVNKSLTHLDLSRNNLSDSGARCIFEGLRHNTTLVNMSLQRNYIAATNPDTARSLTKMLQVNKTLTHLDISYNQFENGICTFQGLKLNSTLLLLNLRSTGITDDNAKCIGQALESNCTLQTLDISHNPFLGVTGTFFILDSLVFSTTLKKLYVDIKLETKNEFHRARRKKGLPSIDIIWW